MIEDLQDEMALPKKNVSSKSNKKGMFLVLFVIWVIFTAITILICKPKIDAAIKETNAIEVLRNRKKAGFLGGTSDVTLYYVKFNSADSYSLVPFDLNVRTTGESLFHDTIEALLAEPESSVLASGAISFIPKGTKLRGLSVAGGVAFVSLSRDFLQNSGTYDSSADFLAREQIIRSLQQIEPSIYKLIILVDGKEV